MHEFVKIIVWDYLKIVYTCKYKEEWNRNMDFSVIYLKLLRVMKT